MGSHWAKIAFLKRQHMQKNNKWSIDTDWFICTEKKRLGPNCNSKMWAILTGTLDTCAIIATSVWFFDFTDLAHGAGSMLSRWIISANKNTKKSGIVGYSNIGQFPSKNLKRFGRFHLCTYSLASCRISWLVPGFGNRCECGCCGFDQIHMYIRNHPSNSSLV